MEKFSRFRFWWLVSISMPHYLNFWLLPAVNIGWNYNDRSIHLGVAWLFWEAHGSVSFISIVEDYEDYS
jgi:hypothetical protein